MQIMPTTAESLGVDNAFIPTDAIPGAAKLLRHGIDKHGSVEGALGDYYGKADPAYIGSVARNYALLNGNGTPQAPPTGADALAALARSPGGVPAGTPGAASPLSAVAAARMNTGIGPGPNATLPAMPSDYVFGKGMVASPDAVAKLAELSPQNGGSVSSPATQPSAGGTVAQAQPDLSDAALINLVNQYHQSLATPTTPAASGRTDAPSAPSTSLPSARPVMDINSLIDTYNQSNTFPLGKDLAVQALSMIQKMMPEGYQLMTGQGGVTSLVPTPGGPADPNVAKNLEQQKALGHTIGTPGDLRQGAASVAYSEPGGQPAFVPHLIIQNPHLPEGAQLTPPPANAPPGTPPTVATLAGGAPAIQSAATAEAAGKAAFEPTTIAIAGREYPVTHEQFRQITQQLGIPEMAAAAGAPPVPSPVTPGAPVSPGPSGQGPGQPNIGTQVMTTPEHQQAEILGKEYAGVVDSFNHAQAAQGPLTTIANSTEFRTGPSAPWRLAFQKGVQDLSQGIGVESSEDFAKRIAAGEIIGKSGTQLGFALSRTLGTREAAQLVQQAIATNPGLLNSPEGNKQLIALINQGLQRDIDKRQFYDNWFNTRQHSYDGAGVAFNNSAPVEKYISNVLPFRPKTPEDYNQLKGGVKYINPDNGNIQQKPLSLPNG